MVRRTFLSGLALSSVAAAGAVAPVNKTITFHIKGFTCVTCAVGLDTLLAREAGVIHVQSSYSKAMTHIDFRPAETNESHLRAVISGMGFTAL